MKKLLSCALLTILFASCNSGKWDQSDPEMPDELRTYNQEILDEELAILEETPDDMNALFEVAFRYQQLGDWRKAVFYYEKVLELSENDWATLNNLAYMYEKMEDYKKAAEYIKQLYMADPTNIEVTKDTVRILLKAEDVQGAQEALDNFAKEAIDNESPNPDMQALVDELYADIAEWEAANE